MLQSALSLADVGQNYKMTLAHTYLRFFYFKSNFFTFQIFIFVKDRDTVKYFHICGQVCFVISLWNLLKLQVLLAKDFLKKWHWQILLVFTKFLFNSSDKSSIIKQRRTSRRWLLKKKHTNFFGKINFRTPWYAIVRHVNATLTSNTGQVNQPVYLPVHAVSFHRYSKELF